MTGIDHERRKRQMNRRIRELLAVRRSLATVAAQPPASSAEPAGVAPRG